MLLRLDCLETRREREREKRSKRNGLEKRRRVSTTQYREGKKKTTEGQTFSCAHTHTYTCIEVYLPTYRSLWRRVSREKRKTRGKKQKKAKRSDLRHQKQTKQRRS